MHLSVTGLDENTTEEELTSLFSKIGTLGIVKVIRDVNTGQSKKFAIIEMPDDTEGQEAIQKLKGIMLSNKKLSVSKIPDLLPGEMEFRTWLNENAHLLLQKIGVEQGQTILDFGCGPGIFSLACAEIVGRNGKVYAIDTRSNALERLMKTSIQKGLGNIETALLDSSSVSVSLANESIDIILLYDVLQEIKDKQGLLKELFRVLKPDGFISIFPMHMGTEKCMTLMNGLGMFQYRDSHSPQGLQSSSEILNFNKSNTFGDI